MDNSLAPTYASASADEFLSTRSSGSISRSRGILGMSTTTQTILGFIVAALAMLLSVVCKPLTILRNADTAGQAMPLFGDSLYGPFYGAFSDEAHMVFVYGTLKRGFFNYNGTKMAENAELIYEKAYIPNALLFVDAYYIPYMADLGDARWGPVPGEVYRCNSAFLGTLDKVEGVAKGRYARTQVTATADVTDLNGTAIKKPVDVWVYHLREVPPGNVSEVNRIEDYTKEEHERLYVARANRNESRYQKSWGGYE
jgi:gamma-glutamylcyclotransferase (GGCT)/AIG2-like uncharacterized protein YtfP